MEYFDLSPYVDRIHFLFYEPGCGGEFMAEKIMNTSDKYVNTNYVRTADNRTKLYNPLHFTIGNWINNLYPYDKDMSLSDVKIEYTENGDPCTAWDIEKYMGATGEVIVVAHWVPENTRNLFPNSKMMYLTKADDYEYINKIRWVKTVRYEETITNIKSYLNHRCEHLDRNAVLAQGIPIIDFKDVMNTDILFETFGVDISEHLRTWTKDNIKTLEEFERVHG